MSRRRNRHRKRNSQPLARKKPQKLPRLPTCRKQCHCNAGGFSHLPKFLKKKIPPPERGLECSRASEQEPKARTVVPKIIEGEEIEFIFDMRGFPPKATAQVISHVDMRYENGVYTNRGTKATEGENLGFLMDCLEVMDWEHTCSHAYCSGNYSIPRSGDMVSSCEILKPWSGEDWRMDWFSDPDMMDLSYESCRE